MKLRLPKWKLVAGWGILLVLSTFHSSLQSSNTANVTLFGPESFTRATGQSLPQAKEIQAPNLPRILNGSWNLNLANGQDQRTRISSGKVQWNSEELIRQSDFNKQVTEINRPILLKSSNQLGVQLQSEPGAFVAIKVTGQVDLPPAPEVDAVTTPTSEPSQTIQGKAEPQTTIELSLNGENFSQTTDASTGAFSINITLQEGDNVLTIREKDPLGLLSPSVTLTIVLSTKPKGVIVGEVLNSATEEPLAGAEVSSLDHTKVILSDAQGKFVYKVEQSGVFRIKISKEGFTYAQRSVKVDVGEEVTVGKIYLIVRDTKVTEIDSSGGMHQNSKGTIEVEIPPAAVVTSMPVQATQYEKDRELPGKLPDTSFFTYAADFGPEGATFSKPVTIRIANSLGLPPGSSIPVGVWNQEKLLWEHAAVAKVTADGKWAEYQITHFSPHDVNLPARIPGVTGFPDLITSQSSTNTTRESKDCIGSAIGKQSGELIQTYQIPSYRSLGADRGLELLYNSQTTDGAEILALNRGFDTFANIVAPKEVQVDLQFFGQQEIIRYQGSGATIRVGSIFSTKDSSGKPIPTGAYSYEAKISHGFDGATFGSTTCFGCDVQNATNVSFPGRLFFTTRLEGKVLIENGLGSPLGNGWRVSNLQRVFPSPNGDVLLLDEGGGKILFESGMMVETIAGTGVAGFSGEGLLATEAKLSSPQDLAMNLSGELFITDFGNNRIRKITAEGFLVTVAGGGSDITSENIPAVQARLGNLRGISTDGEGNLYLVESDRARIRRVGTDGIIQTVYKGSCQANGCRSAPDDGLVDVAVDLEGNLLFTDGNLSRLRKFDTQGNLTDVIKSQGPLFLYGDRPLSQGLRLTFPQGLSVTEKGEVLFANATSNIPFNGVWRLDTGNVIRRLAGTFDTTGYGGEGVEARQAHIAGPLHVVEDSVGNVYFIEGGVGVRKIDTRGILTTVAGKRGGLSQTFQAIGPARGMSFDAQGVAVTPTGEVVFSDRVRHVIRRVVAFKEGQAKEYTPPEGEFSKLIQNADGTFVRKFKNGGEARFDKEGLQTELVDRNGNTTAYEYDSEENLIRVMDPVGLRTNLFYSSGKLSQIEDPSGRVTRFDMDENGNLAEVISPTGEKMTYTYDASNKMTSKTDSRNAKTEYIYSEKGGVREIRHPTGEVQKLNAFVSEGVIANPTDVLNPATLVSNTPQKLTDGKGGVATNQLDDQGLETEIKDPLGRLTKITRNSFHLPTAVYRPDLSLLELFYDGNGNMERLQVWSPNRALVSSSVFTYEPFFHQITSVRDPNLGKTFFEYDSKGNLIKITNAQRQITRASYNNLGLVTQMTDALGKITTFNYDNKGNLVNTIDPLGNTTTFNYDNAGNVTSITDAEGKTTQFTYDAQNRLTSVKDAAGGMTTYSYAQSGCGCVGADLVTSIIDSLGQTTQFEYDAVGNLIAITDPSGKVETREYDLNRNLVAVVDRNGNRIAFNYDAANQLTQVAKPEEMVTFAYNVLGAVRGAANSATNLTLSYDGLNRLTKVLGSHLPVQSVDYSYDAAGNVIQTKGPHGTILTPRDALNRVANVQVGAGFTFDVFFMGYDAVGQRTSSFHQLTELIELRQYDAAYRLTQWQNKKGQSSNAPILSKFDYTYDKTGNRTRTVDPFGAHNYIYDNLYRLLGVDNPLEAFAYDKVGNRLSSVELKENPLDPTTPIQVPLAYTYNENNQLISITKDGQPFAGFTYDSNGNVLTKTVGGVATTYTWDSENRLIKVQTPTQIVEFAYDPFGRRIQKKVGAATKKYLYDREDIVAEYDGSNVLQASYIHGPDIDEPLQMKRGGVTYFYQRDGLGSIASLSDNAGNKVRTYRYDSFGNVISETGAVENPYIYTGRERDSETGLYYYRARYYDPQLGRFLNEDPIGFASGDENFYAYVLNNPINFIDPLGFGIISAAELDAPGASIPIGSTPEPVIIGTGTSRPLSIRETKTIGDVAIVLPLLIPALEEAIIYTVGTMTAIIGGSAIIETVKDVSSPTICPVNYFSKEHTKDQSPSKWNKHTKLRPGDPEKGDEYRYPSRKRPPSYPRGGPWPPRKINR